MRRDLVGMVARWWLSALLAVYLTLELLAHVKQTMFADLNIILARYQVILVIASCVFYGMYRIVALHPAFQVDYLNWLKSTPWKWGMPLPLGPIHLVGADILVLTVSEMLLWWSGVIVPLLGVIAFLAAYLLFTVVALFMTGEHPLAWAVLFGFGISGLMTKTVFAAALLGTLYGLASLGTGRSFRSYPWPTATLWRKFEDKVSRKQPEPRLGWPYDLLRPVKQMKSAIPLGTGLAASLLPAWYLFVIMNRVPGTNDFLGPFRAFVLIVAGLRFALYRLFHAPPINLPGRIGTGQLLIPRYDQMYVAPLLSAGLGWLSLVALRSLGAPDSIFLPVAVAATLLPALNCGPTRSNWELMGAHRLKPLYDSNSYVRL